MSSARRLALANASLKASKDAKLGAFPASLPIRLTPMTPRTDDGAKIAAAWNMTFKAPGSKSPDGTYWLTGDEYDYTYNSGVRIVVPTEPDRLYVMDCRALHYNGWLDPEDRYSEVGVTFHVDARRQDVRSEDGHLVYAFSAEKATSEIEIVFVDASISTYKSMVFWGCDIGPAG
jgi:hypothetical protein